MSKLTYVQGDATLPQRSNPNAVVYGPHCCNDAGGWGSGYVVALTKRFGPSPSGIYKMWHKGSNLAQIRERLAERNDPTDAQPMFQTGFWLGGYQLLHLPQNYVLVNMIGQHNYGVNEDFKAKRADGDVPISRPPVRYGALAQAMYGLASQIRIQDDLFGEVLGVNAPGPAEIHAPRFGSELAGGDWKVIEQMILELWVDRGIPVTVYEWVK